MYNFSGDKSSFEQCMHALKAQNQEYKEILQSKQYKTGKYLEEIAKGIRSPKAFRNYCRVVAGKFRWRKLCKRFPIESREEVCSNSNYYLDERIAIYTCIFGAYDQPQEPLFIPDNCDYYIITDQKIKNDSAWKILDVSKMIPDYDSLSNAERNRYCKMMPHILFPEYRFSVYIDGNIRPITDFTELVNRINETGMALHIHKSRKCVYDEIEACKILKKASTKSLDGFKKFLEEEKFPKDYGMSECNVIVREHNRDDVISIMEKWWEIFHTTSAKRDQLIFPYVLYKNGLSPYDIGYLGNNVQMNPALRVTVHL